MKTNNNRLIVVLGMHRSGTSAITRGLKVMGVELGDRFLPTMEGINDKGFWEDLDLNAFNEEILREINSSWYSLSPIGTNDVDTLNKKGYIQRAVELLRQKLGSTLIFGFKDPRVAKLLPFWKKVFHQGQFDVDYVIAVRNPLSVVKSLSKRDGLEVEQSYLLWLGYVITSLIGSADSKRLLVDFDRLMQSPDFELNRIAKSLDLKINPTELNSYKNEFLDLELRHTVYDLNDLQMDNACPPIVREVYNVLFDVATEKVRLDDLEIQKKVESWSVEFERLRSPLLLVDRLLAQKINSAHTMYKQDVQVVNLNQALAERDGEIANLNQALAEREGEIANLNQALAERDGQIDNLNKAVTEIYGSTSWRLSSPVRFIGRKLYVLKSLLFNSALRPIRLKILEFIRYLYFKLPLSQNRKNQIKDFCYQHLSTLFRNIPSYQLWKRSNAALGNKIPNHTIKDWHWQLLLPSKLEKIEQPTGDSRIVDIIIPVYRGLEQTQNCINSVLTSFSNTPYRLVLINDASPEVEMTEYLRSLSSTPRIIVIENVDNLGFTATVNRGMTLSDKNDVLLLNSDTEVANDWLDKISAHAYSCSKVGTVTPFSNNATICNYPTLDGLKKLPVKENVSSLDLAFASANKGRNIEIPTAVGFCMYIRRDCLNDVGLFDVETFGKGYGEENDFCLRATAKGWKHLLAADTFVFHEGEVSFQADSNPRKAHAMNILRQRYPEYEADIAKHIGKNEAYPLRVAATAARYRQAGMPVVLHVLHAHGGGTQKHVEELSRIHSGKAKILIMNPIAADKAAMQIRSTDPVDALDINLPIVNLDFLLSFIESFGVTLVHVHHLLGYPFEIQMLIEKLAVPFYLTVHDYMLICPRVNMMPIGEDYCGEPQAMDCNRCLAYNYPLGATDIIWWRESHTWLFNDAAVVICPTQDVAQRCRRYFPKAKYRVVGHEALFTDSSDIQAPSLKAEEPLRIALLGVLARHKGLGLIEEALLIAKRINAPLQFRLIGYAEEVMPSVSNGLFTQTGVYVDAALPELIEEYNPHLILFPARGPETYSYTLTVALKSRRPIMVPNLGAFPERVNLRPWTWVENWDISAAQLINKLREIREIYFATSLVPEPSVVQDTSQMQALVDHEFYKKEYWITSNNGSEIKTIRELRTSDKITALVLIENAGSQPSPCAYIRLLLPLMRERGEKFDFRVVTPEQALRYTADVLICQRTAVTSIETINKITNHCKDNGIPIVYDLDDLLLALPSEHPEHAAYASKAAAVLRWLNVADEVWVSTRELQHHIAYINPRTQVVPNHLDKMLWVKPKKLAVNQAGKNAVRLLYMGTQTHGADFELVKNALKRLKREFSNKIEINLIGIAANMRNESWYKVITPPLAIGASYPAFVNWLVNDMSFDIGIAPLVDNEFNRCKSAIKYLDYSALGLATVTSDINGYALIRNGENGFRVKNTDEGWYAALKTLITDSTLREKIQHTAQTEVFEKYDYASVQGLRTKHLNTLLSVIVGKKNAIKSLVDSANTQNEP